jgi:general secretion pathway protein G
VRKIYRSFDVRHLGQRRRFRWRAAGSRASARGFTLIELLIVITLVILLASLGLATYTNSVRRAREAVLKEDLFRMRDAIDQYYADKQKYPATLQDLVSDGYLREIPKDPITDSADTWVTEPAEIDATNPSSEPGVFDVKSGSEETSMEGTKYSEWD